MLEVIVIVTENFGPLVRQFGEGCKRKYVSHT
jgi:hypothetical protein